MKSLSDKELSMLVSLALDNALDDDQKKLLDEYLTAHPEAGRELKARQSLIALLASRNPVPPNPHFWTKVSAELREQEEEKQNLLPFPRKYVPLATTLGVVAFLALGITVFLQREPLLKYLTEKSAAVQQVYESSILKGSVMPLFADLGNDDVLQYAVFGTLPLDKESETALRVDEASAQGYRIEVGLTADQKSPKVTVRDLLKEVKPSSVQAVKIDSVLREARRRIEQTAFYSENNALAIDPELIRFNRVVLTNIAAVLAPVQRARLDRFLQDRNAPYAIASDHVSAPETPELPMPKLAGHGLPKDFIVITPDSFAVTTLNLNIDSIMGPWSVNMRHQIPDMQRRLEMLVRSRADRPPSFHAPLMHPGGPVRVVGEEDMIMIEMDSRFMTREPESMRVVVQPRGAREKFFQFEFRTTVPRQSSRPGFEGNIRVDMEGQLDSMMREIQMEQEEHVRQFMRMDSLFREKARARARRGAKIWADTLR